MYRIFKESYPNLINSLDDKDVRYKYAKNLELLCHIDEYKKHKENKSLEYRKIGNLIYYIQRNIDAFPRLRYFISILGLLGVNSYNTEMLLDKAELMESTKMLNTIMCLNYWK